MHRMAKDKSIFSCTECGGTSPKWLGKCPHCEAWNTLVESRVSDASASKNRYSERAGLAPASPVMALSEIEAQDVDRTHPPARMNLIGCWVAAWLKAAWC